MNSYLAFKNPEFTNDGDSDHNTTITLVSKVAGRTNSTIEKSERNHFGKNMPSMSENVSTTFRDPAKSKHAASSFRNSPIRADTVMNYVDNLQIIKTNVGATYPAQSHSQFRLPNASKTVHGINSHKKQKISQSYINSSKRDYNDLQERKQKANIFAQIVDKKTNKLLNSLNM